MTIEIKTFNQLLGDMARKIIADTPLNDINTGSVLLTLLEAAAQNDFENNASILNLLELLNIDAVRNNDLDTRAADFGLKRFVAQKATGFINIFDTGISKRSTALYQVKLPPIAGQTSISVNDARDWAPTGNLFIGRGTSNFEGPIAYTSIVDNGSFYTINLGSALEKDHLISDSVIDAQGTADRLISAGTIVNVPANNQNPIIEYVTLRDAIIPSGEDRVENVAIVALQAGSRSNAGINTITNFTSLPFPNAALTNTTALTDGRDVETDDEFRERIKAYPNTLARGTKEAILNAVLGVSDAEDARQVSSAVLTEPPKIGDPSILYIDDGGGFEPSFQGQSVDVLLSNASGKEEFLQLSNYPLTRPQIINTSTAPFELANGMLFRLSVDGVEETITFNDSDFVNIAAATLSEVIVAINNQSELFKATFTENTSQILLFPTDPTAEIIQVSELKVTDNPDLYANTILKFPTNEFSSIKLYLNNTLLREKEKSATILSNPFSVWNISSDGSLIISVDGTPAQVISFNINDFEGSSFAALQIDDWVKAFNAKFCGITATATSSGRLQIVSNKEGGNSSLKITGGTYFSQMFDGQVVDVTGQSSDYQLNRQTGQIRILTDISEGDSITAGTDDAKGSTISEATPSGNYNISTDANNRPSEAILVDDAKTVKVRTNIDLVIGSTITITDQGSNTMRLMSNSVSTFIAAQPNDFIYIVNRGGAGGTGEWIDPANTGLYKIFRKGIHGAPGVDSYIEVKNVNIGTTGVAHTVLAVDDIQVFSASEYPQKWVGTMAPTPASAPIQGIVDSINNNTVNTNASIFKTNRIKVTSTTEEGGSFAMPVTTGNASLVFNKTTTENDGNVSHIASRVSEKDIAFSSFKRTVPTSEDAGGTVGRKVWLNRYTYSDVNGVLADASEPGVEGVDTYSDNLVAIDTLDPDNVDFDDILVFTGGNNEKHYRSIRDKLPVDRVGTQHELPRTLLDHTIGDEFNLFRPNAISSEDSIIFILDQDNVTKTIDVPMSRKGRISSTFLPTSFSFSAFDADNESGITFGNLQFWDKLNNNTEFQNYAVWMYARNWYSSGGATSGGGTFLVRAKEFGPHGENIKFKISYPSFGNQENLVSHVNSATSSEVTYFFGSDSNKVISMSAGANFSVTDLGGDNFRYKFNTTTIDFSSVLVGDIVSILDDSGVSASNRGQFRVNAVDDVTKSIDVYNPNAVVTSIGSAEITEVTTVDDIVGSATTSTVTVVPAATNAADALDGKYFVLNDSAGTVAVYFNSSTPNPGAGALSVDRVLEVPLVTGDTDVIVAAKCVGIVTTDSEFTASNVGPTMTIASVDNGPLPVAVDGAVATGFTFGGTIGVADVLIDGKYFILEDSAGTVAFWYDTTGGTSEPLHGATRSIEITTVAPGDVAADIATKTAVAIVNDAAYATATVVGSTITVTDAINGNRTLSNAGTSGFLVTENTPGVDDGTEVVAIPTSFNIYSLLNNSVSDIVAKVSESPLVNAVAVGDDSLVIPFSTEEERYTPAGIGDFSVSLGYGHDPIRANNNYSNISLYDGIFFVKDFENSNPHFTLKSSFTLQGVSPTVYSVESAPNFDTADLGEFFKLVPVTLNNIYHHFTQKALSQLPIVADINISNAIKRIQIKSKLLGSEGAVEIVGGNANTAKFSILGEAQSITENNTNFIAAKVAAFPITFTKGDLVKISNTQSVQRLSALDSTDTVDVFKSITSDVDYRWNPKETNLSKLVRFTISDVSASHGRPAGYVWRWEHNDGGSSFVINDLSTGATALPDDEIAVGGTDAPNVDINILTNGAAGVSQSFAISVGGVPAQADYFTFSSASGETFAAYFDIDLNGTLPTGASFLAATNQIKIEIASTDTENAIIAKVAAALTANITFLAEFSGSQTGGATFANVKPGDLLAAHGNFDFTDWNSGNLASLPGNGQVAGFPIVAVNETSSYIEIINPNGQAMVDKAIGAGSVQINPTPIIEWKLNHSAKSDIIDITVVSNTATVSTTTAHKLKQGDTATLDDNALASIDAQPITVIDVINPTTFTYTSTSTDGVFSGGSVIESSKTPTKYKIKALGFNNLMRLSKVSGDDPGFIDCGAAVDEVLVIKGSTFESNNAGRFRILALDNDNILYMNENGTSQVDTLTPFNNIGTAVVWTSNSNVVTGASGSFKNVSIGEWVKKPEDDEDKFVQVIALQDGGGAAVSADIATRLLLGKTYSGSTDTALGISFDQISGINGGVELQDMSDISIYGADSAKIGDSLFIDNISNANWFDTVNSGTYNVTQVGTDPVAFSPFVRIDNPSGSTESGINIGISTIGFFLIEDENDRFETTRMIEHIAIDDVDPNRRTLYMTPAHSAYKMSQSNGTQISAVGKLDYNTEVTSGIDGYNYYTGLLRTVQRVVDGFEPDTVNYPGQRGIGSVVEILPPLPNRIKISIDVTTNEGVNLTEINNDIKSAIIRYVNTRGVGQDIILSEIIVEVMKITGVEASTFNIPAPSTERIAIGDNERSLIEPSDISIS